MKNTLIALAAIATLALAGCGWVDKQVTSFGGSSERCYKNVLYVNFTTGATPVYKIGPNGELLGTAC